MHGPIVHMRGYFTDEFFSPDLIDIHSSDLIASPTLAARARLWKLLETRLPRTKVYCKLEYIRTFMPGGEERYINCAFMCQ